MNKNRNRNTMKEKREENRDGKRKRFAGYLQQIKGRIYNILLKSDDNLNT